MRRLIAITAFLLIGAGSAAQAQTSTTDGDLTCKNIDIPLSNIPSDAPPMAIDISPDNLLAQCSSDSGAPLTLVSPQNGIAISADAGAQHTATFTVKDDKGNQVTANVNLSRE